MVESGGGGKHSQCADTYSMECFLMQFQTLHNSLSTSNDHSVVTSDSEFPPPPAYI